MATRPNTGKGATWILLYALTGLVDLIQILIDFTGIGIIVSEALEVAMPVILIAIFQFWMKISLVSHPSRLLSIIGVAGLDGITGGIAPFWIFDVWYLQRSVRREYAEIKVAEDQEEFLNQNIIQPLYKDGRRNPAASLEERQPQPQVMDGIRAPKGGLER